MPRTSNTNYCARRADGLALVAESFIEHGPMALNGGERTQVMLHIDAETYQTLWDGGAMDYHMAVGSLCQLE